MDKTFVDNKQFFNHYYFKTFKKGQRVYTWARVYNWTSGEYISERREGVIIKKKTFAVTMKWKNIAMLETMSAREAVDRLSLCYEPNDILKDVL